MNERPRILPGTLTPFGLGFGGALWVAAAPTLRAAAVGAHHWPAAEAWATAGGAALLGAAAARATVGLRGRLLLAAALAIAGVAAVAGAWLLPPALAAGPVGAVFTALPAPLAFALLAACCCQRGRAVGPWAAAAVLGWLAAAALPDPLAVLGVRGTFSAAVLVFLGATATVAGDARLPPRTAAPLSSWRSAVGGAGAGIVAIAACAPAPFPFAGRGASAEASAVAMAALVPAGVLLGAVLAAGSARASRWWGALAWTAAGFWSVGVWSGASAPGYALGTGVVGLALGAAAAFAVRGAAAAWCLGAIGGAAGVAAVLAIGVPVAIAAPAAVALALVGLAGETLLVWPAALAVVAGAVPGALRVDGGAPQAGLPHRQVLAACGPAAAVYDGRSQSIDLLVDGEIVDCVGPDHAHAELAAVLLRCLLPSGAPVAVVGTGSGRLAETLRACDVAVRREVGSSRAVLALQPFLSADGPVRGRATEVAQRRDPAVFCGGTRRYLLAQPRGVLAGVAAGEPLLRDPTRATRREHEAMRHAVGSGLVVQTFLLERTAPDLLFAALQNAAAVHPWCGVFVADGLGAIVGAAAAPDLDAAGAVLERLPAAVRWLAHRAGLGAGEDLAHAFLGVVAPAADGGAPFADDRLLARTAAQPDAVAAVAVLRAALAGSGGGLARTRLGVLAADEAARLAAVDALHAAAADAPRSVLLRREAIRARQRADAQAIARLDPADPRQVARAAALAAAHLGTAVSMPILQAACGLPDRLGERSLPAARAAATALALDPSFAATAPAIVADLVGAAPAHSPLQDLHVLPAGGELAALAAADTVLGFALRARFGSRCAAALVQVAAQRRLAPVEIAALRELADPFVLEAAADALSQRSAGGDLPLLWREDLPAVPAIAALLGADGAARRALAAAVAARKDQGSIALLAALLVDARPDVRAAAGASLFRTVGARIDYDPEWPPARLQDAAERLRALHNP